MSNVFGFCTAPSQGGDFLPVLRYDARAGRFFRVDRVDEGQGFQSVLTDITDNVKFIADFDNLEVGWINLQPGTPPSFALVPMGQRFPDRPTEQHKQGVRFLVKLTKECAGPDGKADTRGHRHRAGVPCRCRGGLRRVPEVQGRQQGQAASVDDGADRARQERRRVQHQLLSGVPDGRQVGTA